MERTQMSEKNWRERVFIFGMIGVVQWLILLHIAMLFYAGGTMVNSRAPGYSYWLNFFSDLGRTKAYSGKDNTISMVIFIIAGSVLGLAFILFAITFKYFFNENNMERKLSLIGTVFLIINGVAIFGTTFTPADILQGPHYNFNVIIALSGLIGWILYIIVIFHNKDYSNKYALLMIVILLAGFIYSIFVAIFLNWPQVSFWEISTTEELMFHTVQQKITTFINMSVIFLINYGAWKRIKS
jgi:hypothetical protein